MKKHQAQTFTFNEQDLYKDLMRNAKVLGISVAAAELMSLAIAKKVAQRVAKRAAITTDDLNRFVAEAADKYNKDLAYFYRNRGKII